MWRDDFSWSQSFSLDFFGGKELQKWSRIHAEV